MKFDLETIGRMTTAAFAGAAAVHCAIQAAKRSQNGDPEAAGKYSKVAVDSLDEARRMVGMPNRDRTLVNGVDRS